MHDDKSLIKSLEEGIVEADLIINSLNNKAKFSKKLVNERKKMVEARSLLLKDLWTDEKLKYRKNSNIIPSYLELNTSKVISSETICSRIRHKLFESNGKMRRQSNDKYTKRENTQIHFTGIAKPEDRSPLADRGRLQNRSFVNDRFEYKSSTIKVMNNSIERQTSLKMQHLLS